MFYIVLLILAHVTRNWLYGWKYFIHLKKFTSMRGMSPSIEKDFWNAKSHKLASLTHLLSLVVVVARFHLQQRYVNLLHLLWHLLFCHGSFCKDLISIMYGYIW